MAVTDKLYKAYEPHLKYMLGHAKMQYKKDLAEVQLILVPAKLDIPMGAGGNPAIYVHSKTMGPAMTMWKERLTEYFSEHGDEVSKVDALVKAKAVLVREPEKLDTMFACVWSGTNTDTRSTSASRAPIRRTTRTSSRSR